MCGILALASSVPRLADGALRPMPINPRAMARLARRGPDGHGTWMSPCGRVQLAHTRLAIQDLSEAARQPMADAAAPGEGVVITYNGEIYNAPALRRELERSGAVFRSTSDTEVLVHGYAAWGIERLLDRVRGMYAMVILDRRAPASPVIHAAVDHAGMKPLVWWYRAGGGALGSTLAIASDADALRLALADEPGFSARLDGQALAHVLSVGYCPAPWTVWRGVSKLGPGERLTWRLDDSSPRIQRHWSPPEHLDAAGLGAEFDDLFRLVVDEHMLADVPVGLFLSAGLDSTSVALALAQAGRTDDVTACTLSHGSGAGDDDESAVAAATARAMMMRHRSVRFAPQDGDETGVRRVLADAAEAFDEPQGFTALLTAVRIAQSVRAAAHSGHTRPPSVILAGDGGDEALAGYAWHRPGSPGSPHPLALDRPSSDAVDPREHARLAALAASPDCDARTRAAASAALASLSYTHRLLCRVYPGFHPAESCALLASLEPEYDAGIFGDWLARDDRPALPHPRRAQRLDLLGFCAGSILPKVDRAAMHVGLELRAPFLDRRVLEWALPRPPEPCELDPAAANTSKPPLRRLLARGIEAGLVPRDVLSRRKQGFSLRLPSPRVFTDLASSTLPSSALVRDGIIRRDYASFLPGDADAREARSFGLCMLAAWYGSRC